jgi:hypothetical protein
MVEIDKVISQINLAVRKMSGPPNLFGGLKSLIEQSAK